MHLQLDDMGMSQQLQVLDLPLDPARHVSGDEFLPRNNLQRHLLVRDAVHRQLDFPKAALAERADDMVGADALLGLLLRSRLGGPVLVAIWLAATARIRGLVLCSSVCGWRQGDL